MLDLEPPKPTKEFHDAYLEIYGKGKKKTESKQQPEISFNIPKKNVMDDLSGLDIPPLKLETAPRIELPKANVLPPLEIPLAPDTEIQKEMEPKKGFFGLFGKKKDQSKETKQKEFSRLADLDLPPLKAEEHKELIDGEPVDLTTFSREETGAMSELENLDLPPPKVPQKKPSFFERESAKKPAMEMSKELPQFTFDIESPMGKPLPTISPLEKARKDDKLQKGKPIHDFLAEIKFGAKKEQRAEPKPKEMPRKEFAIAEPHWTKPTGIERKEALFEKEKAAIGARDLQTAYEKTHRFETGGFEYMEPIKPIEKAPTMNSLEELQLPQKPQFSAVDSKKYMREVKEYEQQAKKAAAMYKKKQAETQTWIKKQEAQDKKLDEKMRKMQTMQRELEQKQQDVMQFEPKMQALWKKEDEISAKEAAAKQKLDDAKEIETRIRAEEDSIIAKIKKLEADQKKLEKEEDAIAKTVARLDKDRAVITAKTREFANIIKEIGNAEKELKEKSQLFDDREARIKRKEKIVEAEFAKIQKLKKTAESLKDVEETYARVKERLRIAYKEYEEKFSNQQAYAPQEIRAIPIQPTYQPVQRLPQAKAVDSGDITNLVTGTKQLIIDKHYEEANKNINRLMQRYMQIPDNNPRKKEIYYEIVGLKNMLKLDLLE